MVKMAKMANKMFAQLAQGCTHAWSILYYYVRTLIRVQINL